MNEKECVFIGCNKKAVGKCSKCGFPFCSLHLKKINNAYVCVNCLKYSKK